MPSPRAPGHPLSTEAVIASPSRPTSRTYSEEFVPEDEVLVTARAKAAELGCTPVAPGAGAALRLLTATLAAKAVVEVGTGTGVSGVWLLRGMAADGVLTTVDVEAEHQRAAREAFTAAGVKPNRTRVITGRPLEVLGRLTDGVYDLVFLDGAKDEYVEHVDQAHRLLRTGGLLVVDDALWHDKVADPAQRDTTTTALRELGRSVRDDERWTAALLPVGGGLLAAVKH